MSPVNCGFPSHIAGGALCRLGGSTPPAGLRPLVPEVALLEADDAGLLGRVAREVFDGPLRASLTREFLEDPRHHLVVALEAGEVVGFASAVHYVHPDKDAELWVNEVGVAPGFRGRGLAKEMLGVLFRLAESLGCREAWVLTDGENEPAKGLYRSVGGVAQDAVMFSFTLGGDA